MTTTSPPFLLPALTDPYVQPVASRSTSGLIHMVIRGDVVATSLEVACQRHRAGPGDPCLPSSFTGVDAVDSCLDRNALAASTLVTRWYCTGTQRPHNGPHCGPDCEHIRSVREQLEREDTK